MELELKLPPSVNKLHLNQRGSYKRILTSDGRDYIYVYSFEIASYLRRINHIPFDDYFYLDIDWYLPRKNCDAHNYKKGLLDLLEKAGFVTNDKYIMDRTQSVQFDTRHPRCYIRW